jgi:hypothetical protein
MKKSGVPSVSRLLLRLLVVTCTLRLLGFARTTRMVRGRAARRVTTSYDHRSMEQLAKRVAIAAALCPGRARCLEQALVVFDYLGQPGAHVVLKIGVQPHGFKSHAWVEVDGKPLNDHDDSVRSVVPILQIAQ